MLDIVTCCMNGVYKKLYTRILAKPPLLVILPLVYGVALLFGRWGLAPTIASLLFLFGIIAGIFAIDICETVMDVSPPSPFRSMAFWLALSVVSIFVITSNGSVLGAGMVLSLQFMMLLLHVGEWNVRGHVAGWYQLLMVDHTDAVARGMLLAMGVLQVVLSWIFVN